MDRNSADFVEIDDFKVALRKESVDRNRLPKKNRPSVGRSLSARRAWIEMIDYIIDYVNDAMSLSARRAWIEIKSSIEEVSKYVGRSPQGERG